MFFSQAVLTQANVGVSLCVCISDAVYSIQIKFCGNQLEKKSSRQVERVKSWLEALERLIYK